MFKEFCTIKFAAPRWTIEEREFLKAHYMKERDKGTPHNIIYQNLADKLGKSYLSVKQMIERMYKIDEDLKKYKYESWNREKIINNIKELYEKGEPINRLSLPRKVRWQIDNHSLPKSEIRGFETWWNSTDDAISEAIYEVGFKRDEEGNLTKNTIKDMLEAKIYFQRMNKLSHSWSVEEIKGLLQEAHEAGLPLTLSFLARHPEIYKPLLNVNRSLEGLKDTIKRIGVSWSDIVLDVAPEYKEFYSESGRMKRSTEEIRVQRFLELNNVPFELGSKMTVEDPELVALGYKHFVPDFVIIDEDSNLPVAFVEVFGSIVDSQAANTGEIYKEKIKAKEKYFNQLPLDFIPIYDSSLGNDMSNEALRAKFAPYIKEEPLEQAASIKTADMSLNTIVLYLLLKGLTPIEIATEYNVGIDDIKEIQQEQTNQLELEGLEETVLATVYHAKKDQTDSTPHITADNSKIDVDNVPVFPGERIVALSRDLLGNNKWHPNWKGSFEFGDIIEVKGAGNLDGLWIVRDTMNARFTKRIDFLIPETAPNGVHKNVKIKKVGHNGTKYIAEKYLIKNETSIKGFTKKSEDKPPFSTPKQQLYLKKNVPEVYESWKDRFGKHPEYEKYLKERGGEALVPPNEEYRKRKKLKNKKSVYQFAKHSEVENIFKEMITKSIKKNTETNKKYDFNSLYYDVTNDTFHDMLSIVDRYPQEKKIEAADLYEEILEKEVEKWSYKEIKKNLKESIYYLADNFSEQITKDNFDKFIEEIKNRIMGIYESVGEKETISFLFDEVIEKEKRQLKEFIKMNATAQKKVKTIHKEAQSEQNFKKMLENIDKILSKHKTYSIGKYIVSKIGRGFDLRSLPYRLAFLKKDKNKLHFAELTNEFIKYINGNNIYNIGWFSKYKEKIKKMIESITKQKDESQITDIEFTKFEKDLLDTEVALDTLISAYMTTKKEINKGIKDTNTTERFDELMSRYSQNEYFDPLIYKSSMAAIKDSLFGIFDNFNKEDMGYFLTSSIDWVRDKANEYISLKREKKDKKSNLKNFCKTGEKSIMLYRAEKFESPVLRPAETERALHLSANKKIAEYYATREGEGFIYTVKIPLDDRNLQEGAGRSEYVYWGEIPNEYIVNTEKVSKDKKVELDYGRSGYESTNTNLPSGRYYNTPYDGSV